MTDIRAEALASERREAIYAHLVRLADLGKPCPSNRDLADVAGYANPDTIDLALQRLRAAMVPVEGVQSKQSAGPLFAEVAP